MVGGEYCDRISSETRRDKMTRSLLGEESFKNKIQRIFIAQVECHGTIFKEIFLNLVLVDLKANYI